MERESSNNSLETILARGQTTLKNAQISRKVWDYRNYVIISEIEK